MADILGQMFFAAVNGTRVVGWSEDHYIVGAGDLGDALSKLTLLAQDRSNLLGAGAVLNYIRVSDISTFRDSQIQNGIYPGATITKITGGGQVNILTESLTDPGAGLAPSGPLGFAMSTPDLTRGVATVDILDAIVDQPQVGYLVRLELTTPFTARRSLVLRGMPDAVVDTSVGGPAGSNNAISTNWIKLFNKWGKRMVNGSYGMRGQNPAAAVGAVATWTIAGGNNTVTATTTAPLALSPGDHVRVSGVVIPTPTGGIQSLNAALVVLTAAGGNAFTFTSRKPNSPFTHSTVLTTVLVAGKITKQQQFISPYVKIVGRRWGERKCGIPFDPAHGRLRARR